MTKETVEVKVYLKSGSVLTLHVDKFSFENTNGTISKVTWTNSSDKTQHMLDFVEPSQIEAITSAKIKPTPHIERGKLVYEGQ